MNKNTLVLSMPVVDGRLAPWEAHKAIIHAFLAKCGPQVKVTFERPTVIRSRASNRYMWGAVYKAIAEHSGHEEEELRELFKDMFLGRRFIKVGQIEREVGKSTADLNQVEFGQYLEKVIAFAATELGIAIPGPNEI